jgi:hypothetical protein
MQYGKLVFTGPGRIATPIKTAYEVVAMAANSEERIAELGKLLKGKIRSDWALLDEAYREPFAELMGLLRHRESVVACLVQAAKGRGNRKRNDDRVDAVGMQLVQ